MDFDDSAEEAAFREEARAWIAANAIETPRSRLRRLPTAEWLGLARTWQARKAAAGYVAMAWPTAWGGRGWSVTRQIIFDQEERAAGLHFPFFETGLGLCVPTVATYADAQTTARFTGPAMRGEEVWCQLFSEPATGSDLAGLRTRAARDGEAWVVNGQKVWTTGGQFSDFGLLLARTSPEKPRHRGLTMFWVDMRAAGVEVRPIRQMYGTSNFNEVFLSDVRLADSQRLGPVDAGWSVALTTLSNERVSIGDQGGPDVAELIETAAGVSQGGGSALESAAVQAMIVGHHLRSEGVRLTRYRLMTAIARGEPPGSENAVAKLVGARHMQEVARDGLELQGAFGLLSEPALDPLEGALQESLLWSPGYRIAGGTDEILKTILAERVLGLPVEPRADKDRPFQDLGGPAAAT